MSLRPVRGVEGRKVRVGPVRGPAVRGLGLRLPPARMAPLHRGRPLKRWRYVAVYGPELMLCVGDAHVAGVPQRWWAVALPDGTLRERTSRSADARFCSVSVVVCSCTAAARIAPPRTID